MRLFASKKHIGILLVGALLVGTLTGASALTTLAAKPQPVVEWSNGFPSGEHFNLNIHGKKVGFDCDPTPGGGSVFVPEYGDAEIQYIQNKKSSLSELYVKDPCSFGAGDPAKVQLPKGEYQVYTRILGKPAKDSEPREVVFYPKLVEACNDTASALDTNGDGVIDLGDLDTDGDGIPDLDLNGDGVVDDADLALYYDFSDATDCSGSFLLGTGVITDGGVFDLEEGLQLTRGKGKSKAVNVTDLFQWSGYACDQAFDTNGNGEIDLGDLDTDGDGIPDLDLNGDGVVDELDLALYLEENCQLFESEWIFNIADLVVYGWDYKNNGSKLVQVRFYPVKTTTFE